MFLSHIPKQWLDKVGKLAFVSNIHASAAAKTVRDCHLFFALDVVNGFIADVSDVVYQMNLPKDSQDAGLNSTVITAALMEMNLICSSRF